MPRCFEPYMIASYFDMPIPILCSSTQCRVYSYATNEESTRGFRCGNVYINDRFALTAAHCPRLINGRKIVTIRDQTNFIEQIGVKRAFVHPLYKFPSLYYDIALYELDRRILYSSNLTIYKDTPACLQKGSANLLLFLDYSNFLKRLLFGQVDQMILMDNQQKPRVMD